MARGNNKMQIFWDATDYSCFESILGEAVEEYELDCWAICGMASHYHLAIREDPDIADFVRKDRQRSGETRTSDLPSVSIDIKI